MKKFDVSKYYSLPVCFRDFEDEEGYCAIGAALHLTCLDDTDISGFTYTDAVDFLNRVLRVSTNDSELEHIAHVNDGHNFGESKVISDPKKAKDMMLEVLRRSPYLEFINE